MLLAFVLLSGVGGVLTAGFALPFVGATSAVTHAGAQLFDELPTDFNILEPSEVSVIRAADGTEIAQFYAENRIVVPLDQISVNMQNAIVAVEDQRFYQHKGVDPTGMVRALVSNAAGGSQGASTLTQQYVRNVLVEAGLQTGDPAAIAAATERSTARKLREIKYALTLEQTYTKQQILEGYLNIAAFGPSTYGVEASSRHFFSHSAAELTVAEAALLAGLTNAPGAYDPIAFPEEAKGRMDWVLLKMYEEEFITQEQYDEAVATQIEDMLNVTNAVGGCGAAGAAAYFCEYVVGEIESSELFGATEAERRQLLLRGGLTITTTLDLGKQAAADAAVQEYVPTGDPSNVKASLVSVEPGTGRILAISQNTNYGDATEEDPTATQISLGVDARHGGLENRDGTSGFQPGSTFKTFVLAQWYQEGRSGYTTFNTSPTRFPASTWNISCAPEHAADWNVDNANPFEGGTNNVIRSTQLSINVGYARMTAAMDICSVTDLAAKMGVTTNAGEPLAAQPSIALGSQEVTSLQMANAYATFAAHGVYCKPIAIDSITDSDGTSLAVPSSECTQVMEAEAADQTALTLTYVMRSPGTGDTAALAGGRPSAGKTGTTELMDNAWFVGFTPSLSAAVWLGHSEGYSAMNNQYIGGRWYSTMYGSDAPAPLWKMYMDAALADTPHEYFTQVSLGVQPMPTARPTPTPTPEAEEDEQEESEESNASNASSTGQSGEAPATALSGG
ncbi:penicillin-binding protein [Actinomyces sp. 186855]|nr:penicillin-binding protein [Actinomyces sp. AC-20-1]MCL3789311.1 penicillin-binding protein [Actinomyces sp. 187325]MCL3792065.1 penicillin-binding protein [Actinomyces sp. 186855]MCL3793978.1 penicillin-binding protein [Actinomyces sp. 217892]